MKKICLLVSLFSVLNVQAARVSITEYLKLPANPMKISVQLDDDQFESQMISAEFGGVVTLKTKSGDVFELKLPPHSLKADTYISLRNLKSVKHKNLPNKARYLGVEISPEGLQLNVPATLTIKPKVDIPLNKLVSFSSQASGDETHLTTFMSKPTPKEIKLALLHFSNYTVADDPTVAEMIDQAISNNEAQRISNYIARILQDDSLTDLEKAGQRKKALVEVFQNVITPNMASVQTCASAKFAMQNYTRWAREIQLMGEDEDDYMPADFKVRLQEVITAVTEHCLELAIKACYEDHQPIKAYQYVVPLLAYAQVSSDEYLLKRIEDFKSKCLKFRFFFESEIWEGDTREESRGVTAKADFKFDFDPTFPAPFSGTIQHIDTYLNKKNYNCERTAFQTQDMEFYIGGFTLNNVEAPTSINVLVGNPVPLSLAKFHCVNKKDKKDVYDEEAPGILSAYFTAFFVSSHMDEFDVNTGMFNFTNWQLRNDHVFAEKVFSQKVQNFNESTTMIIYHEPEAL